jgi:hypothetical protein
MTFSSGEATLSTWIAAHARVCWLVTPQPWLLEQVLIEHQVLPLNLDQNRHGAFHAELTAARAHQRNLARSLPIIAR